MVGKTIDQMTDTEKANLGIRAHRLLLQLYAEQEGLVIHYTLKTKDGEELEFSTEDYIDPCNPRTRTPSIINSCRRAYGGRRTK